mmetsp:Transcript_26572/g.57807  ORF Transcript_26572/g.57807 Transcript_26572/m.57807 type:complete len:253 (-) Transcript_26572:153-911(-)
MVSILCAAQSLLQVLLHSLLNDVTVERRLEPLHHPPLPIHQKLHEVPLDVLGVLRSGLLDIGVHRVSVGSVDVKLGEHGERDPERLRDVSLDARFVVGLLPTKLIARECHHHQSTLLVLSIQLLQRMVGLSLPSSTRNVDDEGDAARVLGQLLGLPVDVLGDKVVQTRRLRCELDLGLWQRVFGHQRRAVNRLDVHLGSGLQVVGLREGEVAAFHDDNVIIGLLSTGEVAVQHEGNGCKNRDERYPFQRTAS